MSRVRPPVATKRMPDRPGRWKLIWRRQRRMLRPAGLIGVATTLGLAFLIVVHVVGQGAPLRERLGRATASLGLRVAEVRYEGLEKTPKDFVRSALGVSTGDPILGFSVADARARLETLTWVQSATVERHLPSLVVVRIVERRPFAVWQNQGKFSLIDKQGEVVTGENIGALAKDLPLVVGPGAPQAAAGLLDLLSKQPSLQPRVTAAVRVGERRWNLRMTNGADVLLPEGAEAQALAKLVELQAQHALLDRPIDVIDLRFADRLVVRAHPDPDKPDTAHAAGKKPT